MLSLRSRQEPAHAARSQRSRRDRQDALHPRGQAAAARHQARLRAADGGGDRRHRPRRAQHHGREHRGRREAAEPAVPGHRHSDLQRRHRQERRVRRRRDEGGDPPRLRARHHRASAALLGGASAHPQERADLLRHRRADHQRRFRWARRDRRDRDDPEGLGLGERLVPADADSGRRRQGDQALRHRQGDRMRRPGLPADHRRRRHRRHLGPLHAHRQGRGDAPARHHLLPIRRRQDRGRAVRGGERARHRPAGLGRPLDRVPRSRRGRGHPHHDESGRRQHPVPLGPPRQRGDHAGRHRFQGRMTHHILETPVTEAQVRALKVGDTVTLEKRCSASATPT